MKVIIKNPPNTNMSVNAAIMICTKKDPFISVYCCSAKNDTATAKPIMKSLMILFSMTQSAYFFNIFFCQNNHLKI